MSIVSIFFSDLVILILFIFSFKKYLLRKNTNKLLWTIGFFQAFIAVTSFLISIYTKSYIFFYIYYFLGAGLTPALLGLGSIYLLKEGKYKVQTILLYLTIVLSILLIILFVFSSVSITNFNNLTQLIFKNIVTAQDIKISLLGVGVIRNGNWLIPLVALNTIGTIELLYVSLYSFLKDVKNKSISKRSVGVFLIFIAVILIAVVSSISRFYNISVVWLGFLLAWIVFFVGYILT